MDGKRKFAMGAIENSFKDTIPATKLGWIFGASYAIAA